MMARILFEDYLVLGCMSLLCRTGQYAKAIYHNKEALRITPRMIDAWVNLGLSCIATDSVTC